MNSEKNTFAQTLENQIQAWINESAEITENGENFDLSLDAQKRFEKLQNLVDMARELQNLLKSEENY